MDKELPITTLVTSRMAHLHLSRPDLALRLGYANISRGCRRIDAFLAGKLDQPFITRSLAAALETDAGAVNEAMRESTACLERRAAERVAQEEREWRQNFRPHGIIETEESVPRPLFLLMFYPVLEQKVVTFDPALNPVDYARIMQRTIPERTTDNGIIIGFGKPTGFVVNHTPDRALRYTLDGQVSEELDHAVRLGRATVSIRGKPVPPDALPVAALKLK